LKKTLISLFIFLLFALLGCSSGTQDTILYTDDLPFEINMKGDSLKILQLTDLHLTYGLDANDRATIREIEALVKSQDFDLVVITGDMTMSVSAPTLFAELIHTMEALKTPWTFVFGNHETDYDSYNDFLDVINGTQYLYFKAGPELDDGGVGNFRIVFNKDNNPFYTFYFLDSHAERSVYTDEQGMYDYVKISQVNWVDEHLTEDVTDSVMYMHIPLRQFMNPIDYVGIFNEDKVYAQGVDTGLFSILLEHGKTKGVFVGHDHLNNFHVNIGGIMLAYGQITGYNAYGDLPRGGRVVEIDASGTMSSYILLESEVPA